MIFYVGDTHGRLGDIREIEEKAIEAGAKIIVQVGDFGMHFGKDCQVFEWFNTRSSGLPWITCGGNHDNWPLWRSLPEVDMFGGTVIQLAPECFFAERGTTLILEDEKHLFFGGAESIDKVYRTEGFDWWEEETPNIMEVNRFFDELETFKPEVVVTHEAPLRVNVNRHDRYKNTTPRSLENVLKHCDYTPSRWYFGHHHMLDSWEIDGIAFYCCGLHGQYYTSDGHAYDPTRTRSEKKIEKMKMFSAPIIS
jgi:predicted phosphodiesterase